VGASILEDLRAPLPEGLDLPSLSLKSSSVQPEPALPIPTISTPQSIAPWPVEVEHEAEAATLLVSKDIAPPRLRYRVAARASLAGVVLLSLLSLNGSVGEVRSPIFAISVSATRQAMHRPSMDERLNAMEGAARAVMPGPIVLSLISPGPLQTLDIPVSTPQRKRRVARQIP
jgi:hypothetical protein